MVFYFQFSIYDLLSYFFTGNLRLNIHHILWYRYRIYVLYMCVREVKLPHFLQMCFETIFFWMLWPRIMNPAVFFMLPLFCVQLIVWQLILCEYKKNFENIKWHFRHKCSYPCQTGTGCAEVKAIRFYLGIDLLIYKIYYYGNTKRSH